MPGAEDREVYDDPAEENYIYSHLEFLQRSKGMNLVGTVTQLVADIAFDHRAQRLILLQSDWNPNDTSTWGGTSLWQHDSEGWSKVVVFGGSLTEEGWRGTLKMNKTSDFFF